jgi:hypothetical protein
MQGTPPFLRNVHFTPGIGTPGDDPDGFGVAITAAQHHTFANHRVRCARSCQGSPPQLLQPKLRHQAMNQLSNRIAPVALSRAAGEIARGIMHGRDGLVLIADTRYFDG